MALDRSAPIGVFDSGLGGLTVAGELASELPAERIVYLGDTARVPYGTRSAETVVRYARGCASLLVQRGVKLVVVACNTVSAVALDLLRAELDLPVIGVVEPGAVAAVRLAERVGASTIGVLGTQGTIASGAYARAVSAVSTRFEVVGRAAPLLVPLVEEGWIDGDVPAMAAQRYVAPLVEAGAGVIVLGCTHYPVLRDVIAAAALAVAGRPVPLVDGARATAAAVACLVRDRELDTTSTIPGGVELLVTDLPASFEAMVRRCLGREAPAPAQVDVPVGPA